MEAGAGYALEVEDLTVRYGGVVAVNGVSLKLGKGEIRGVIGPNGAGKSTVIDAISGRRASTGKVVLHGLDISSHNVVQRRQSGLSRSFQRTSVFPAMRVRDQIELAASKVPGCDVDELLAEFGLTALHDKMANRIGYGDQRRLDLSLAFLGKPSVLLLDEPMAGLSVEESRKLADHLQSLARNRGVSLIMVEHDMEIVFGICDMVTVLESGKLIAENMPDVIRADPHVRAAYLGSAA